MRKQSILLLALSIAFCGCSSERLVDRGDPEANTGGSAPDSGIPADGATPTDGASPEANTGGSAPDGGIPADGATPTDGASPEDASTPDAGSLKEFPYLEEVADEVRLVNWDYSISFNLKTGYFDVFRSDRVVIRHARAEVKGADNVIASTASDAYSRSLEKNEKAGGALSVTLVNVATDGLLPRMALSFTLAKDEPGFQLDVTVTNDGEEPLVVKQISPAVAHARRRGALFVGADPARHRILENGSDGFLDFYVHLLPGDVKRNVISDMAPWESKGNSVSNWNHAVYDLDSKTPFVAGFLSFERTIPFANTAYDPAAAPTDDETGRKGFTHWSLDCPYIPVHKSLASGEALKAETAYVDAASTNPLDALERYAGAIARFQNITLWTKKIDPATGKPFGVPNGWTSWTGSHATGGYGNRINEALIEENLEFMAREFEPFGVDWFQIDDGWQIKSGDWQLDKNKFPSHPEEGLDSFQYLTGKIREKHMKPGLWLSAFTVHDDTETYAAHPEWFAKKMWYGENSGYEILDFTKPEVVQHVGNIFEQIAAWGFRWVKLDFAYWILTAEKLSQPNVTPVEAYRIGLKKVREVMGPNTHFLAVSALGAAMGIADSNRITLDDMPVWDGNKDMDDPGVQGIKPTYRTVARRYYLSHRVWINHPDMLFFRPHVDPSFPRITLDESKAFATVMALTGGTVKIGEKLVEMKPEWVDTVRKLLPAYPGTGRPLDLFEREFPEAWHERFPNGPAGSYDLLGLINWGVNKDLTTNPYTMMPDAARTYSVSLADLGLDPSADYLAFEFWDQKYMGAFMGTMEIEVPPHRAYVIALRKREPHPQFIGTNRHILMGAVGVNSISWDEQENVLSIKQEATPGTSFAPFEYRVTFSIPAGWGVKDYSVSGLDKSATTVSDGKGYGTIAFFAKEKGEVEVKIYFARGE